MLLFYLKKYECDGAPDVSKVIVNKNMMSICKLASSRYKICLEEEAKQKKITEKEKRKLDLRDELRNNVEKRRKMEKSVERIVREADELSLKAVAEKNFAFLAKSSAKRLTTSNSAEV